MQRKPGHPLHEKLTFNLNIQIAQKHGLPKVMTGFIEIWLINHRSTDTDYFPQKLFICPGREPQDYLNFLRNSDTQLNRVLINLNDTVKVKSWGLKVCWLSPSTGIKEQTGRPRLMFLPRGVNIRTTFAADRRYLIQPFNIFWQQYEQAEGTALIVELKAHGLWLFDVKNLEFFFHGHH